MRNARGFTIIELLVVLVIVSLLIAMAAVVTRAITSQQRRSTTAARIANVDAALQQFVIVQKRLPCPADGALASTNAGAGMEGTRNAATGCTTDQKNGVVPWRALGLAETDATDGWERRLTFRIPPYLAIDSILDMSPCDPAGGVVAAQPANALCQPACTAATLALCMAPSAYLAAKGLTIQNVAGTGVMSPPTTGAAYVVVSHGESGGGGMLNSGLVYASTTTDSAPEQMNYVDNAYAAGSYVDDSLMEAPGASHFDDIVSRPTILSVVSKAGLGPRSHP
jgi:prepilin-type N-terminal cleavage/methylation domain-containing protein